MKFRGEWVGGCFVPPRHIYIVVIIIPISNTLMVEWYSQFLSFKCMLKN